MYKNKTNRFTPLFMAICVVIGILIGTFYANHFSGNRLNIINTSGNKLNNLLHIIDDQYVDTVNINDLVEQARMCSLPMTTLAVRFPEWASSSPSARTPYTCRTSLATVRQSVRE